MSTHQKTVLITGSNKGIGLEIGRQLGQAGFHVVLSGRNAGKLEEALAHLLQEQISAESLLMDVSHEDSVRGAADLLNRSGKRLDVLINNAAILDRQDLEISQDDLEIFDKTLQTNCRGALMVTRHFLPCFQKPGQVIMISSGGGSMSDPVGGWSPAYCLSKSLLNAITRHLAYELHSRNISVNAVCPGWVRTDMGGKEAPLSVEEGAATPVWLALQQNPGSGQFFRDKQVIPW